MLYSIKSNIRFVLIEILCFQWNGGYRIVENIAKCFENFALSRGTRDSVRGVKSSKT